MIAFLLAAASPALDGTPLGVLPPQSLPASGCAAYLFTGDGTRRFVAMASADAGTLRVAIDGTTIDAARARQAGAGGFGFATTTEYRAGEVTATLDLTTVPRADVTAGATVPQATLRIERMGKDGVVVPLVGLIGCNT